ncbi:hydrogenase maturation protease [Lentzea waywayandensis]|uniref:Hydrogenase maturation protease n=1 Tax=Lentzea waywayandensis TaxID=84724 RepID=A0A1I6DA10_9PSEU|nr:hydrogenase maturation protease [Lentzea waywayandensis]SFR02152.1 hydrogenase maturation protease [Lentzea waywayandensis]
MTAVVIGVGNEFRRDDGIGPAVARAVAESGVHAEISDGDPARLLEAWDGADLVVIVDAIRCTPAVPGRWHRTTLPHSIPAASSHGLGVPEAVELAEALDRRPEHLVIYAVEVADVGFGIGLSPAVAAAAATLTSAVLTEVAEEFPGTDKISNS